MVLVISVSCCPSYLSLYTRYLSEATLASYIVNTPDPTLECPPVGQRLVLNWSFPKELLKEYETLSVGLTIRFRNHKEITEWLRLNRRNGTYVYDLVNSDFFDTGGFATYKADLYGDGQLLEEWRHEMWTPLITFESPTGSEEPPPVELPEGWGDISVDFNS